MFKSTLGSAVFSQYLLYFLNIVVCGGGLHPVIHVCGAPLVRGRTTMKRRSIRGSLQTPIGPSRHSSAAPDQRGSTNVDDYGQTSPTHHKNISRLSAAGSKKTPLCYIVRLTKGIGTYRKPNSLTNSPPEKLNIQNPVWHTLVPHRRTG